jgi:hypothetical protein
MYHHAGPPNFIFESKVFLTLLLPSPIPLSRGMTPEDSRKEVLKCSPCLAGEESGLPLVWGQDGWTLTHLASVLPNKSSNLSHWQHSRSVHGLRLCSCESRKDKRYVLNLPWVDCFFDTNSVNMNDLIDRFWACDSHVFSPLWPLSDSYLPCHYSGSSMCPSGSDLSPSLTFLSWSPDCAIPRSSAAG